MGAVLRKVKRAKDPMFDWYTIPAVADVTMQRYLKPDPYAIDLTLNDSGLDALNNVCPMGETNNDWVGSATESVSNLPEELLHIVSTAKSNAKQSDGDQTAQATISVPETPQNT